MKLKKRCAVRDEKERIIRAIRWCREHHMALAGLPFDDPLVGEKGIHLEIIAPEGSERPILEQALREGYDERDVVSHSVVIVPAAWFEEAKEGDDA